MTRKYTIKLKNYHKIKTQVRAKHQFSRNWFSTPKAKQKATISEIKWAAGFLEGEGSFTWCGGNSQNVRASNKNKEPLQHLQNIFGGSIHFYEKIFTNTFSNYNGRNWQNYTTKCHKKPIKIKNFIWIWLASGSRARGIMMTVYSFMSDRRKQQIKKALNHQL